MHLRTIIKSYKYQQKPIYWVDSNFLLKIDLRKKFANRFCCCMSEISALIAPRRSIPFMLLNRYFATEI